MIRNKVTDRIYIGSAVNVSSRISHHKLSLKKKKHDNGILQEDWIRYGEKSFEFTVVEYVPEGTNREREQFFIDKFQSENASLYNISKSAFSNLGVKRAKSAIEKMIETKLNWSDARKKEYSEKCRAVWNPERKQAITKAVQASWEVRRGDHTYRFTSPDGEIVEVKNLKEFCDQRGLNDSAMIKVSKGVYGRNSHKGWTKA